MDTREHEVTAARPSSSSTPYVVMACEDMGEAEIVGRKLLQMNIGILVTYRRLADLVDNAPAGKVALIILATNDRPSVLKPVLDWLRNRWPRCPITVIGDVGSGEMEMAVRQGGASYMIRPLSDDEWAALLAHITTGQPDQVMRELSGATHTPGRDRTVGAYQPTKEPIRRP